MLVLIRIPSNFYKHYKQRIILCFVFFFSSIFNLYAFTCGTDTVRDMDKNQYRTVKIGSQCWMKENLNVGKMLSSMKTLPSDNAIIEKWCYKNDRSICDSDGGFYTWNEMMQYTSFEKSQGICPDGWHIPSDSEFYTLEFYLDPSVENPTSQYASGDSHGTNIGKKLKKSGPSDFEAILTGSRNHEGYVIKRRAVTYFWTSSSGNFKKVFAHYLLKGHDGIHWSKIDPKNGLSVRCIKD